MERIDAVGLVLAGGHSRRLGRDKRWLPHEEGGSWLERTTALLARFCGEGRIAIATGESFDPIAGWPTVADPAPAGRGPLVGIDAAFRAHPGCDLCVLACDYPQIDAELLGPIYDAPLTTVAGVVHVDHPAEELRERRRVRRQVVLDGVRIDGRSLKRLLNKATRGQVRRTGREHRPAARQRCHDGLAMPFHDHARCNSRFHLSRRIGVARADHDAAFARFFALDEPVDGVSGGLLGVKQACNWEHIGSLPLN